jgi:hypothetical protein
MNTPPKKPSRAEADMRKAMKQILKVPKEEILRREAEYRAHRATQSKEG